MGKGQLSICLVIVIVAAFAMGNIFQISLRETIVEPCTKVTQSICRANTLPIEGPDGVVYCFDPPVITYSFSKDTTIGEQP
jgi:hypothetical protein